MESAVLKVKGLCFAYDDGPPLFDNLSFELKKGTLLTVSGANGSGKSTLLDLLFGQKEPLSGTIEVMGKKASLQTKNLGLLPQNIDYYLLGQSVSEEIELSTNNPDKSAHEAKELASAWGLTEKLGSYVDTLSGGEKKRLALIGALAGSPLILFLDEPFSGLDWGGTLTLLEDLKTLKAKGQTVVLVTHDPSLLFKITDFWLLISTKLGHFFSDNLENIKSRLSSYGVRPF
jgi:ABC-type multidrug transport system ATPase subunit